MAFKNVFDGVSTAFKGLGLAHDPTETIEEHPDRQTQLGAGAFLSVSQQSVSSQQTGHVMGQRTQAAFDAPANLSLQAERMFVVGSGDWTTSHAQYHRIAQVNIPSVFRNSKFSIYGVLGFHAYARFGVEAQIMINPTSFQQGSMIMVAIPFRACHTNSGDFVTNFSLRDMMVFPHVLLNVNANNTGALKVPFVFTRNLMRLHEGNDMNVWTLAVYVWSPLRVGSGTSTKVGFRILARLTDLELHGLRPYTPQMHRVMIDPGVGSMNTANSHGTQYVHNLSLGDENFPLDATMAGGMVMTDLSKQITTPAALARIQMTTTQSQGTLLWQHEVKPRSPTQVFGGDHHLTALAALSDMFTYFRGDMTYMFQILCTKYHSGRIMISFTPGIETVKTFDDHLSSSVVFFDINGVSTTTNIRVPYMSTTMYTPVDQSLGLLTLWVVNELSSPDNVSHTIDIVAMEAGTDNFQFFTPQWNFVTQMMDGEEPAKPAPVETETTGVSVENQEEPIVPSSQPISGTDVVEDPRMLTSHSGTFPEIKPGRRTHTISHVNIRHLLGRARLWQSFNVNTGSFHTELSLDMSISNGPLRTMMRMGALIRGSINLCVIAEVQTSNTGTSDTTYEVTFMPNPSASGALNEVVLASLGYVRNTTSNSGSIVVKLPWYTPLSAVSTYGGEDVSYGKVYIRGFAGRATRFKLLLAFNDETQLLFPMPVQIQENMNTLTTRHEGRPIYLTNEDKDESDEEPEEELPRLEDDEKSVVASSYSVVEQDDDFSPDAGHREHETWEPQAAGSVSPMVFPKGALIRYPFGGGLFYHYAVVVSNNMIVHLMPFEDTDKEIDLTWMTEKDGIVRYEPLLDKKWELAGMSPFPDITEQAVMSKIGKTRYNLFLENCESFAKSNCFIPINKGTMVDHGTGLMVGVGAGMLAAATMATTWMPQSKTKKLFTKVVSGAMDESTNFTEIKDNVEKLTTSVSTTTENMNTVLQSLKAMFDPRKMFKKSKTNMMKWGGRFLSFMLDCVAFGCEIAAIVKADAEIRALLITAMAARFASGATTFLMAACSAMTPQSGVFEGMIMSDEMAKAFGIIIDSLWRKHIGEDMTPQGGIMHGLRDFNTVTMAMKSMPTFMTFLKDLFVRFQHWLNPKTTQAVKARICKKMQPRLAQLSGELCRLEAITPKTSREKTEHCDKARRILKELAVLVEATDGAPKEMFNLGIRGVMSLQSRAAKIIIDNGSANDSDSTRAEPVVCFMAGSPGCGKSLTATALACALCHHEGHDPEKDVYVRAAGAEFWDGYEGQPVMIVDDVGQDTDGEDWKSFCQIVSCAPFKLNMAALTDKGKQFVTPYIILTSNFKVPKPTTIASHQALYRRMAISVHVSTVTDCTTNGVLDIAKAKDQGRLKGMECCIFEAVKFGAAEGGLQEWSSLGQVSFKQILAAMKKKKARRQHQHNSMMTMILKDVWQPECKGKTIEDIEQDDEEFDWKVKEAITNKVNLLQSKADLKYRDETDRLYRHWTLPTDDEIEYMEEAKKLEDAEKRFRRILIVAGVIAAILGAIGLAIAVTSIVITRRKDKPEKERAYTGGRDAKMKIVKKPPGMEGENHADVHAIVKKNTVEVGVMKDGKICWTGNGVFTHGRTMLCVKHCIEDRSEGLVFWETGTEPVQCQEGTYTVQDLEGDVSVVTFSSHAIREMRDIRSQFVTESNLARATGAGTYAVVYASEHTGGVFPAVNLSLVPQFEYPSTDGKGKIVVPSAIKGSGAGQKGLCGSPWVSTVISVNCAILGLHVAGSSSNIACQIVTRDTLEALNVMHAESRILSVCKAPFILRTSGKSKIRPSPFHHMMEVTKEPACLGAWDKRCVNDPKAQIIVKHKTPRRQPPTDWKMFSDVMRSFVEPLRELSTTHGVHQMLTMDQAIDGHGNLEGMDMKTSCGYPWVMNNDPKKRLKSEVRKMPEFKKMVDDIIEWCCSPYDTTLKKPEVYYVTFPKDETLSKAKVEIGRTRYVSSAPFQLTVAARMMFGRCVGNLCALKMTDKRALGVAVGTNPDEDWTNLATESPDWPALSVDYSNFDGTQQSHVITTACEMLAYGAGLPVPVGTRFAEYVYETKLVCGDTMYHIAAGLPSGCPFTSAIGSLCNFQISCYVLSKTLKQSYATFQHWCKIVTYGDDAVIKIHPDVAGGFDGTRFAQMMYTVFSAIATDAADKDKPPQVTTLWETTFLKRGIRMCGRNCHKYHPTMSKDTIFQMLAWQRAGSTMAQTVMMAADMAFHHGSEFFEEFTSFVRRCSAVLEPEERCEVMQSVGVYEDHHQRWMA